MAAATADEPWRWQTVVVALADGVAGVAREVLRRARRRTGASADQPPDMPQQDGTGRDLAQRSATEQALRDSNEKFRQLADNIVDTFWIRSADMREVHYVSPGFERIWGRTPESLYAHPEQWASFIVPEDRARVMNAFASLTGDVRHVDLEYRITRPDGEIRWVRVRAFQVRDAQDRLIRHAGIVTDITERRRDADALRASMEEIRRINRVLKMLSGCNEALIRAEHERELLEQVCRIAVETGGYGRAWVEYADDDAQRSITPMAYAGAPASMHGHRGIVRLPLRDEHRTFGVLGLQAPDVHEASAEELALLQAMADNVASGIGHVRARAEQQRVQQAVLKMAAGVSAASGTQFFEQLARNMADALGAQAGFVAELRPGEPATARTIAAVVNGEVTDNFDYVIAGTPCERLLTAETCVMAQGVAEQFPHAPRLAALGAKAYVGSRLDSSSGEPIGLLFVIFQQPLQHVEFITSTFQIFGARATSELERLHTDVRIREQAALLDIAHDAIMVRDLDNRLIYWNKGAERIFGWTAAEALGRDSVTLLGADTAITTAARAALMVHGAWEGEMVKRTRDGRRITLLVRWTLVCDALGRPKSILGIDTDVTATKELEAQFLRAQRTESIGTMASGIAHDLNNVLTPILMSVEMLKDVVDGDEDREMLATMQRSAQRGAELVRQVLSFARGVEGQRITVNPLHLLRDLFRVMRETFPKSVTLRWTAARGLWCVTGDPTQMYQVLLNLCVNARDAMPAGGSIVVTAENAVLDEASALPLEMRPGSYVLLKVRDTGTGVAPAIRDRIFEPFFTTKPIGEGTGLGLSTTQAIVRSHGGSVRLQTDVGRGSTFSVYLAADPTKPAADPVEDDVSRLRSGQGELILVVDDEASIRDVAQRILERYGYRVVLAANGAEAVALYSSRGGEIAAVLTDMAMPVMDGAATILALRAMNPAVRIIGSSGLTTGVTFGSGGVEHFVSKPYTTETLLRTLHQALHDELRPA